MFLGFALRPGRRPQPPPVR